MMAIHPFANKPPDEVIALAEHTAARSPCAKSKRGVVVYQHHQGSLPVVMGIGYNGPPPGFGCDGSEQCRTDCSKRCVHAEQRALHGIVPFQASDVVHVKIGKDGKLVGGGGPSCVYCSKVIADVGVRGVWLYEYENERGAFSPGGRRPSAEWRFYTADEFHHVSLKAAGVY